MNPSALKLEHTRCFSEFCEMAKKLTLNFKLNPQLKLENFSNFFFLDAKYIFESFSF